ncbi:hypothetical protein [Methylovirgula sp. HY1]|uniref:hypothetical protein n=1 Tax=Methylovirgula sp. HY1 TaxID=2822761 RepID=UPI001C764AF0|nr:hypothetical protein [Methylovirgula sp. HY1]QXX76338.1 hypothetical protein MHY1_03178 [Methylovirgula sp. HY1]
MQRSQDGASMRFRTAVSFLAAGGIAAVLGCFSFAALARPIVPAERRYDYYWAQLPSCADPRVLSRIQSRFYQRESEFWKSGLAILGFDRIREIGLRTNGLDYIPRRYCMAQALMNNRSGPTVSYSIVEDMGIIGWGFGVDWCVAGLDRNYADAPNCKMVRP